MRREAPEGSTIALPDAKRLSAFKLSMINEDRVRVYLEKGWSLGIACKDCLRLVEWTPADLMRKFKPETRIYDIAKRLTCAGDDGCGSHRIAVFPHPCDTRWRWSG